MAEKQMGVRLMWAVVVICFIAFLMFALLIGALQIVTPDTFTDYFLAPRWRNAMPPAFPEVKSNLYEVLATVSGAISLLSLIWVMMVSLSRNILMPGYARGKRPVWWVGLILGTLASAGVGYWLADNQLLAENVPVEIAVGCSVVFLVGYWVVTIFSTPFAVRSGVPFGTLIAGNIRFP